MAAKKRTHRSGSGTARKGSTAERRRSGTARSRKMKKSAAKPRAKARPTLVELRVKGGTAPIARVATSVKLTPERLAGLAGEWMYVLRNRCRWAGDEELKDRILQRTVDTCDQLGIPESTLKQIVAADSRHLELQFFLPEGDAGFFAFDAVSCLPWEFVLSSATLAMGRSLPLLITRHLRTQLKRPSPTHEMLYIESAPGRVEGLYSFESERARLQASIGTTRWTVVRSPTADGLEERVRRHNPRVVHFSGIDTHQAEPLMEEFYQDERVSSRLVGGYPRDGAILRGADLPEVPVYHDDLARRLVGGDGGSPAPDIVTLNAYYSGARTARDCVRHGARAAIGFMDEVDDEGAENLYQTFYWQWRALDSSASKIPSAFGRTWYELRKQGANLFGTGIVLWLAQSAFDSTRQQVFTRAIDEDPYERDEPRLPTPEERKAASELPMSEVLQVDLQLRNEINYSLLHNSRPLVDALTLIKLTDHPLDNVQVEVQLNTGDVPLPFRCTELLLDQPQLPLADTVRVPLTASLLRAPRERIQSTLHVRVTWDGRPALDATEPVTLLPVDEWLDDTSNNPWLPSFVLPRDPAVTQIVGAARRHLITLQDDPGAGFDGYQTEPDQGGCEIVDQQVQAIWTTLVQEYRLAYINPPPAYSRRNQRLRSPSEMVSSRSGTCIDLALLLASCLEYVDIYPVVVLLSGHAFVGYWRAEQYHAEFAEIAHVPLQNNLEVGIYSVNSKVPLVDPFGWRLASQHYREILSYLQKGKIRFLEATGLCFNYSYAEAIDEGRADIRARKDFDSLLDIVLARRASPPVTPLPVILTAER